MNYAKVTDFNSTSCAELSAGGYTALIAPEIGSNCIRLRDNKNAIEFFRFNPDNPAEVIKNSPEVWGLPTLYLPNRFSDGKLKTSDAVYQLPVNEKNHYNNHIHGFLNKRKFEISDMGSDDKKAFVTTTYLYDENDEFFKYLPVKFRAEYTFTLTEEGMEQIIRFTNLSDKVMPVSLGSHTSMKAPFADGGDPADIRLCVPAVKRCELNERCLPTMRLLDLTEWDMEYKNGTKQAVLQNLDNDMYTAGRQMLDGREFHGFTATDIKTGKQVCCEVSDEYKFWCVWNDRGENGYFCPEPMTAMIDAPNLSLPADVSGYCEIRPQETYEAKQHFFSRIVSIAE
ncbi:MAG: aldose 1-epimerase [Oscillospiraceae bacterium]|nr:aldose 1-epimerase [Oscillospiraceae bacterium]